MDPGPRHQARERALSLLYEAEMKGVTPSAVLGALAVPPDPYAASLLGSVERCRAEAEALVRDAAVGWTLERMAVVDRLVLILATAELAEPGGPPAAVVIDEAVELAKTYSTEDSGRFVNGVLAAIVLRIQRHGGDEGTPVPHPDRPPGSPDRG